MKRQRKRIIEKGDSIVLGNQLIRRNRILPQESELLIEAVLDGNYIFKIISLGEKPTTVSMDVMQRNQILVCSVAEVEENMNTTFLIRPRH